MSRLELSNASGVVLVELPEGAHQPTYPKLNCRTPLESYWSNSPKGRTNQNVQTGTVDLPGSRTARTPRGGALIVKTTTTLKHK